VRVAALAGLGAIGNAAAVPLLVKAAATGGKHQEAARRSLGELAGAGIDESDCGKILAENSKDFLDAILKKSLPK
jgi:hypothetical protein